MGFDMQWIDDIHNWKRFRSVQFGLLAAVFMGPLTFYGACLAISPAIVGGVPQWFLTICSVGGMISSALGIFFRGVKQDNLPSKPAPKTNAGMSTQ